MIQIYLRKVQCHEETDEVGADEPFVLVTAVNLASSVRVGGFPVSLPAFDVVRYGPFEDVDAGERHFPAGASQSFWGIGGGPAALSDPDQVIFIASLLENDDGDPEALRGIVKGIVGSSILGTLSMDRAAKVSALLRDVRAATGTPTGGPNFDEKLESQEIRFSGAELLLAESGTSVDKSFSFHGDGGHYTLAFETRKAALVAANPADKWVFTMGNRIVVIVNTGQVFVHDVAGETVGNPFQLSGPAVAANPPDKWVLPMGNRILVILTDGRVFGHDISGTSVGPGFKLSGPPVAANPPDKRVLIMGNRIMVVLNDGRIFAHDVTGTTIGTAFPLFGPPVATNPLDKWVLTMGNRILVILSDGRVFAHDITGTTIGTAFQLSGPPVAANPPDKRVVVMGTRILVILDDGRVFGHDVAGATIGTAFRFT